MITTIKTISIIGAGVAGIGAARLLSQAGFDCEVFEKARKLAAFGLAATTHSAYKRQNHYTKFLIIQFPTVTHESPVAQSCRLILKIMPKTLRCLKKSVLMQTSLG